MSGDKGELEETHFELRWYPTQRSGWRALCSLDVLNEEHESNLYFDGFHHTPRLTELTFSPFSGRVTSVSAKAKVEESHAGLGGLELAVHDVPVLFRGLRFVGFVQRDTAELLALANQHIDLLGYTEHVNARTALLEPDAAPVEHWHLPEGWELPVGWEPLLRDEAIAFEDEILTEAGYLDVTEVEAIAILGERILLELDDAHRPLAIAVPDWSGQPRQQRDGWFSFVTRAKVESSAW